MLAAGAEGETLKQLLEFLGHESINQLHSESSSSKLLANILSKPKSDIDVSLANGVWPDEASQVINAWVKKKTKGLIPSIVQASDFTKDELVVFVNALYFKGAWDQPFEARKTLNKDFYLINGEKVSVPFIKSLLKDGLQNLLAHFLSNNALFHGDFDLKEERLDNVWIPKFEISCAFEPEDVMKQMGLTLPFKRTNTELSGIVDTSHLSHNMLYVSILQKAVIKVDEKGT
ncbi:serpin-ZX [Tanacetum coccineum]